MKQFLAVVTLCGALALRANALPNAFEIIPAKGGAIHITPIYHASMQIEYQGAVIQVDPFSAGDYTGAKKADVILITHSHPDHLDLKAIEKVADTESLGSHIYAPEASAVILKPLEVTLEGTNVDDVPDNNYPMYVNVNGTKIEINTVPMYNLNRGPKPGQKYHPKGVGNGYILTLGGKRIYIAGDTEATPEMKALKNIDVAFLPMNLPYTMTPQEAAAGARAFKPRVVYPYHYRFPFTKPNDNPQQFAKAMAGSGVVVKIRDWYGHPAAKKNG